VEHGATFFVMEFPQGHAFGSASCGYFGNYKDATRLPDIDCEAGVNPDGQRLGSASVMAVYRSQSDLDDKPRIVRLPVTLDGVKQTVDVSVPGLLRSNVDSCFEQRTAVMKWCVRVGLKYSECQTIADYVRRGVDVEFGELLPKWMPRPCDDDRALRKCLISVARRSQIVRSRVKGSNDESNLLVTKSEIELVTTKDKKWISSHDDDDDDDDTQHATAAAFNLQVKREGTTESTSINLKLDVSFDALTSLMEMCGEHDVAIDSCLDVYESAEIFRKQSLYDALVDALSLVLQDDFFFVQIGAHVGNTWNDPIYDRIVSPLPDVDIPHRKNWRGILVEPTPHLFQKLQENYANVPKGQLAFENSAICDKTGPGQIFYSITERTQQRVESYCKKNRCLLSGTSQIVSQIGSLNREHLEEHMARFMGENIDVSGLIDDGEIEVNCLSYRDLLLKHGRRRADWVMIDAEGHDDEILGTILSSPDEELPYILAFEHVHFEDDSDVYVRLRSKGYYCIQLQSMDTFCQRRGGDNSSKYGSVLSALGC